MKVSLIIISVLYSMQVAEVEFKSLELCEQASVRITKQMRKHIAKRGLMHAVICVLKDRHD